MIDVLDRRESRGFLHKKILGAAVKFAAGLIPGGTTALGIVQSIRGRSAPAPRKRVAPRPPREPFPNVGFASRPILGIDPPGVRRLIPIVRPVVRPPSIPPVNPVRQAVIQAKPVEPVKAALLPSIQIHRALPATRQVPSVAPRAPISFRSPAMPIHRKSDRALPAFLTGGGDGCFIPGQRRDQFGNCSFFIGEQLGRDDSPMGETVMGRYGAAYVPGNMVVNRAVCLSGDVVANDGFCYPKKAITNKEREWPRGRQPLLTGGEMRAISVASRAAGKFERTQKRLQKMGMIKKPAPRRAIASKGHQHAIVSGGELKVLSESN